MLIFGRSRWRAIGGSLAALMLLALAAVTGSALASASTARTSTARPIAGKAPLKDLMGQPVRHVTPRKAPTKFLRTPAAVKLPAGERAACPAPKPGQVACGGIFRTRAAKTGSAASATKAGAVKAGTNAAAAATVTGFSPAQLQSAYNLTATSATGGVSGGQPVTVAISTPYDDPNAAADLAAYRTQFGQVPCISTSALASQYSLPLGSGCVTKVNENNQASPLPSAPPSTSGDWTATQSAELDMVSAICPNCQILLVEAGSESIADAGQSLITAENDADVILIGWSTYEFAGQAADDQLYLNAPGKVLVNGAGDQGFVSEWPADSQYVTSVGGTTLTADTSASRGWDEKASSSASAGCSSMEAKPSWQTDTGCQNRTENDVAAVGDPSTPVAYYDSTAAANGDGRAAGWASGGASAIAAGIIAGVYALNGLPQAGTYPASYPYQSGSGSDFNDITSGSDGTCESNRTYLCTAGTGYDGPTGAGTPNGAVGLSYRASGDTVTVTDPGTQDYGPGEKASIPLHAVSSDSGQAITWTASGLPDGLRINSATGAVTGTLPSAADTTATVTATATDASGASGSATFNIVTAAALNGGWAPVSGQISLNLGGKCISANGTTTAGSDIHEWTCETSANENWTFTPGAYPGSAGTIALSSDASVCAAASGTTAGSVTELEPCDGRAAESWRIASDGELASPAGFCLSDPGGSTTNGTQLDLETCAGSASQQWTLPASQILSGVSGKCLSDDGTTANGSKVWPWTCESGNANEQWTLKPDGTIRIGGYCLDGNSGTTDGTLTQLYTCETGNSHQAWSIDQRGELINASSGKCLDDPGDNTTNGTRTVVEDCYGQPGEIWEAS